MFSFRETRKPPNHIRKRIIFDAFGVWTGLQILCTFSYRTRFPPPETASDTRPSSGAVAQRSERFSITRLTSIDLHDLR